MFQQMQEQMQKQAEHVGTKFISDTIVKVDLSKRPFVCVGDGGDTYIGETLIVTTGASARWLGLESEKKYQGFGGSLAAFDPVANVRVGVNVLKECINRAGSLEGGLKLYVGAGNMKDDQGYAGKVMAENVRLQQVAKGVKVPITAGPSTAAEAATARLESLWEKAQRLTPFGKDDGE